MLSVHVAAPRIADSPITFLHRALSPVLTRLCQTVVIGRALAVNIEDRQLINPDALNILAWSCGSQSIRSHDRFELPRPIRVGPKANGKV